MTPAVSVVVASHNYGRYIGTALASLCAQTFRDWEAVIVDDGSTDESLAVIRSMLGDSRIRLVCQQHEGQARTKNRGLEEARGEFIGFLDADDRWHPEKLDKQLAMIRAHPNLGVVGSRRRFIDTDGKTGGIDNRRLHSGRVLDRMYRNNFVCFSSSLVRRAVVEHVGWFDERLGLGIDYDWWLRVARHYEFGYVDEPLVDYRVGHGNLSQRVADRLDTALAIMRRFRTRYDDPPQLNPRVVRRALVGTERHRGLVARHEPTRGLNWLLRAIARAPADVRTWKALGAALAPAWSRSLLRRLRGESRDWDRNIAPASAEVV